MASDTPQHMILRVIEPNHVRKIKLSSRPASVDALIDILKAQLELDNFLNFSLQYEDPDFDGKLTLLVDIEELPQKAVVHIISPSRWSPCHFQIPTFSYDVELTLREGNLEFEKNGRPLRLERYQKHYISNKLASAIHSFEAYPSDREVGMVAAALIAKHPCLREPGSDTGWHGWKKSLKFKMGNYRAKIRGGGCQKVAVNASKRRSLRNPESDPSQSDIKRPACVGIIFLPSLTHGEDLLRLELVRQAIVAEVKKAERNLPLISEMMQTTFALRRQTLVTSNPPMKAFIDLWPALLIQSELYAEFQRITNQNLPDTFYAELDRHSPLLMTLFRQRASKTGKTADTLEGILKIHDEQELHDIHTRRTTVLRALPVYLREDVSAFFRSCVDDGDEPNLSDASMALLTVSDKIVAVDYHPEKISVVLEGHVAISIPNLEDGFLVLFALIHALHLSYPKELINTFAFFQKVLLSLDEGELPRKLQSLKRDLMSTWNSWASETFLMWGGVGCGCPTPEIW